MYAKVEISVRLNPSFIKPLICPKEKLLDIGTKLGSYREIDIEDSNNQHLMMLRRTSCKVKTLGLHSLPKCGSRKSETFLSDLRLANKP